MAKIIVTSFPSQGHVVPLAAIAADLTARGHEVLFHTGSRFEERVRKTGARFVPFPAEVDDEQDLSAVHPEYAGLAPFDRMAFDLKRLFPPRSTTSAFRNCLPSLPPPW
jgi:UDP:flavonoid glycosyltransferase YjiC (YdhE family)